MDVVYLTSLIVTVILKIEDNQSYNRTGIAYELSFRCLKKGAKLKFQWSQMKSVLTAITIIHINSTHHCTILHVQ